METEMVMDRATETDRKTWDLVVVGGGLAGLSAAALVARAGRSVIVLEGAGRLGGRARTSRRNGVLFNLGPRALYRRGHALALLRELGVAFSGHVPSPGRSLAVCGGKAFALPATAASLLSTRLLSAAEKWRLARLLSSLPRIDAGLHDREPVGRWIEQTAGSGRLALLLHALVRVSTYVNDPERFSAGAAIRQLQTALAGNVLYLDGGWQTLVEGLREAAAGHGAQIVTGASVESVRVRPTGISLALAGGRSLSSRCAVLAVDPPTACRLLDLPDDALPDDAPPAQSRRRDDAVRAACLDLALAGLPRPNNRFAVGLDRPFYFSVHSAAAKLAPEGVAVVHVMKYLGRQADVPADAVEQELEEFVDVVQPGWRERVVQRRLLPNMLVSGALPRADEGGLAGRADVDVAGRPGVFLAGDWVGGEGMLADAAAASAADAARQALARLAADRPRTVKGNSHVFR